MATPPFLEAAGIGMTFPGVRALEGVDFAIEAGEVHALVGENGAGKSTLIRVLSGEIAGYDGVIQVDGQDARFATPAQAIARGIAALDAVPGRFQSIDEGQPFLVVVDYAHTDDALRNLIQTARELNKAGRIITLFGCGGDRDRVKRPLMGEAAGSLGNKVVLTCDNPRTEDPARIINDTIVGLQKVNADFVVELDRGRAIELALREAKPGDMVLLEEGHCLRDHAIAACGRRRGGWESRVEATSLTTLIQMVEGGLGVTLLPRITLDSGILKGTGLVARPVPPPAPSRTLALVARRTSSRRRDADLLADFLVAQRRGTR